MYWTSYPKSTALDNSGLHHVPVRTQLLVGVVAFGCSFPGSFGHFVFHTTGTEWKEQFAVMAVRQDGMVEVTWRQDVALNQPEVLVDVCVTRL